MKYIIFLISVVIVFFSCEEQTPKINSSVLEAGARSTVSNEANGVMYQALLPLSAPQQMGFSTTYSKTTKTVSNLGNGRYFKYLNMTHQLVDKVLYQDDIFEARQVCIQAMMNTHYQYTRKEVLEEIAVILDSNILLENEQNQVAEFMDIIQLGSWNDQPICFECEPVD